MAAALVSAACLLAGGSAVNAQSNDTLMLMNRVNDLDSQVQALSRQVNHGGGNSGGTAAPGMTSGAAADLDVRLSQLEDQVRTLTGELETQGNDLAKLRADMDRAQGDMQLRLSDLEAKNGGAAASGTVTPPPPIPGSQFPVPGSSPPATAAPTPLGPPPQEGVLGTLPAGNTAPPPSSPEKEYEAAYNLLGQNDYAGAEKGFTAFLAHYPKHSLAPNAEYWLGETYYARAMMDQAASTFADSYKTYPNGPKAPDSLLKLGMALGQEGKPQEACLSFAELDKQFPAASQKIKASVSQERAHYKCP